MLMFTGKNLYRNPECKHYSKGFTLIELLITIAIVAILAAVVIPSYQKQVQRNSRVIAKTELLKISQDLERCHSTTLTYAVQTATTPGCINFNLDPVTGTPPNLIPRPPKTPLYTITAVQSPSTFLITATPVVGNPQAGDTQCASFSINQAGLKTAVDTGGANTTVNCWP